MSTPVMDEKTAIRALIAVIDKYVEDNTSPYVSYAERVAQLPAGLRLEIHPRVHYMLLRNLIDDYERIADNPVERIPVPVKINSELPEYAWRLVIITEDVINGGVMPHAETPKEPK